MTRQHCTEVQTHHRLVKKCRLAVSNLVSVAILFGAGTGSVWANDECGDGVESQGVTTITCNANNYDPGVDGNIVYLLGKDATTRDNNYRVFITGLSGIRAVTLDNALDTPHDYDLWKPNATWITYAGYGSFTVDVSNVELRTGLTETAGTYVVPDDNSTVGFRGLHVWLENDTNNRPYSNPRHLFLNVRNSEFHTYARAVSAVNDWNGAIYIDVSDTTIRTHGSAGHAIVGFHEAIGDVYVRAERVNILTQNGYGIWGNVGDEKEGLNPYSGPATINLTVIDSNIKVGGTGRAGLYATHDGSGKIEFVVKDSRIEATNGAYGIFIRHQDDSAMEEGDDLDISVTVDGSEIISELHGIIVYRQENSNSAGTNFITIGSAVRAGSAGIGIFSQGNTVIVIGGLVSAGSGTAVQNAGGDLTVRIVGSGRVDGMVTNEAGHQLNIWIGKDLVVDNGQVVQEMGAAGPFDTTVTGNATDGFMLDHQYAPRAAVYEALPGFLLRLNRDAGLSGERMRSPGSPLWLRLAAGTGSYGAERSTVGAGYDFRRFSAEAGMDFRLAEGLTGSLGARLVSGSADVSAPAGGGRIGAVGYGLSFGAAWQGAGGFYGEGRFTATWYNVDLSSAARGGLKKGAGAFVHAFGLEGGRRFALNEKTRLTARAWLNRSAASLAGFRDAVGARVSDAEANRFTGGAGAAVETDLALNGGKDKLSLRGSLGVEQALDGGQTAVLVSGTKLTSKAPDSRILLGLGATYRLGGATLTGAFRADGLGSKDAGYSGRLELRTAF